METSGEERVDWIFLTPVRKEDMQLALTTCEISVVLLKRELKRNDRGERRI